MSVPDYFLNRLFIRPRAYFSGNHYDEYVVLFDFMVRFNAQNIYFCDTVTEFKAMHHIEIKVSLGIFNQK